MSTLQCLMYGALGGACPTLLKIGASLSAGAPLPELNALLGVGVLMVVGGILAMGFGRTDVKEAIVTGIVAPALITNLVAGYETAQHPDRPGQQSVERTNETNLWSFGVQTAFAQVPSPPVESTEEDTAQRQITVHALVEGGTPRDPEVGVFAMSGSEEKSIGTISLQESTHVFSIDSTIDVIRIGETEFELGESDDLDVTVRTEPKFDWLWILGARLRYDVESIGITHVRQEQR